MRDTLTTLYTPFGTIIPTPLVHEVLENKHGVYNPVIDVITDQGTDTSGTNGVISPSSGNIDNANVTFPFGEKPEAVVVNGDTYRENHGWTWSGGAVVLGSPAGNRGDVYGIGTATVFAVQVPGGTIDNANVTFIFGDAPTLVVVNGKTWRSGHGWSGTTTITLDAPVGVGGDIFSIL